jgi:Uri superfamily endonuclease
VSGRRPAAGGGTTAKPLERLYIAAAWVPRGQIVTVGALGPATLLRGWYAYVGSARRGRPARVARHMRACKPLRWHADYLFARYPATRAWLVDSAAPAAECALAAALAAAASDPSRALIGSFGASDCGCPGHLVYCRTLAELRAAVAAAVATIDAEAAATSNVQPGRI